MLCPGATGDDEVEMTVRLWMAREEEEEDWTRKGHSGRGSGQEGINIIITSCFLYSCD